MATAAEIALNYMSPRYRRLERLEAYYDGTQYMGRAPFMATDERAPPLIERAPCVVYGIAKIAIGDLVNFMMGEDRYPHIDAGSSEDDSDMGGGDGYGLGKDDSAWLERWVNGPLTKCARLKAAFPEGMTMAMKAGAVAMVAAFRRGYPCLEALPAKWCTPTIDPNTGDVIRLEVKYPYIVEERDKLDPKRWVEKCYVYRRVIDNLTDTVYLPGEGREDGLEPAWTPDNTQTAVHGLGYCPVKWYAFDRSEPTAAHYDGRALHQLLDDEIDALNFSKSMHHRAALYSGDPQIWETGVDEFATVAPPGRAPRVQIDPDAVGPDGKKIGVYTASPRMWRNRGGTRMKGPGVVWRYPDPASKVGMLVLPAGALEEIRSNSDELRKGLAEDMSVVILDPAEVKTMGALSGKALAFMFARQIAKSDKIRQEAGDRLILACVDLLLRMCLDVDRLHPGGLRIPGIRKALGILKGFERDTMTGGTDPITGTPMATVQWFGPRLELEWGKYFQASAEEENFIVTLCVQAKTAGLMPLEVILEKLRSVFPFKSTEELMEALEEEAEKVAEKAAKDAEETAKIGAKYAQGQPDGPPWPPEKGSANGARGDAKA